MIPTKGKSHITGVSGCTEKSSRQNEIIYLSFVKVGIDIASFRRASPDEQATSNEITNVFISKCIKNETLHALYKKRRMGHQTFINVKYYIYYYTFECIQKLSANDDNSASNGLEIVVLGVLLPRLQ